MPKKYSIVFLVLTSFKILAQHPSNTVSPYTWENFDTGVDSTVSYSKSITKEYIWFSGRDFFERTIFFHDSISNRYDTLVYHGKCSYSNKENKYYFRADFTDYNSAKINFIASFESELQILNDSSIKIFKRAFRKQRNYNPINYISSDEPRFSYYLENTVTKRKIKLEDNVDMDLNFFSKDSTIIGESTRIVCHFDSLNKSTAFTKIHSQYSSLLRIDNSTISIDEEFRLARKEVAINFNSINYIKAKTPARRFLSNTSKALAWISLLELALVPIIYNASSIKNNETVANNFFIASLSGLGVSLPLAILGKYKKCAISREYKTKESNYWLLKQGD